MEMRIELWHKKWLFYLNNALSLNRKTYSLLTVKFFLPNCILFLSRLEWFCVCLINPYSSSSNEILPNHFCSHLSTAFMKVETFKARKQWFL